MAVGIARVQRQEQAVGPVTFGAQISSIEFSSLGSEVDERVIREDMGEGQEGKGMAHF